MDPHSHSLKLLFGILGNIIGVGVNLAPMITFWNIYKEKDTRGFSGLPYVFTLLSLIWVLYGLPTVTSDALLIITINVASSTIQIFYLAIFLTYAEKKPERHLIKVMAVCFVLFASLAVLTLTVVPQNLRSLTVGSICVVIGVVTYASPLSVARKVFRTRSVEFLPIYLCMFMFINSTIWSCYGIITTDIFILIPNGLGIFFGVAQLSLYAIFRNAKPLDEESKIGDVSVKGAKPCNAKPLDEESKIGDVPAKAAKPCNGKSLDEESKIGDASMPAKATVDKKSVGKLDGKSMKGDRDLQPTTLPSQGGNNANLQTPFVLPREGPRLAVIVYY